MILQLLTSKNTNKFTAINRCQLFAEMKSSILVLVSRKIKTYQNQMRPGKYFTRVDSKLFESFSYFEGMFLVYGHN